MAVIYHNYLTKQSDDQREWMRKKTILFHEYASSFIKKIVPFYTHVFLQFWVYKVIQSNGFTWVTIVYRSIMSRLAPNGMLPHPDTCAIGIWFDVAVFDSGPSPAWEDRAPTFFGQMGCAQLITRNVVIGLTGEVWCSLRSLIMFGKGLAWVRPKISKKKFQN